MESLWPKTNCGTASAWHDSMAMRSRAIDHHEWMSCAWCQGVAESLLCITSALYVIVSGQKHVMLDSVAPQTTEARQ